jgi:hypothetical protein
VREVFRRQASENTFSDEKVKTASLPMGADLLVVVPKLQLVNTAVQKFLLRFP